MKGLFFGNRVRVPTISFLDEIRTAVGETLGGAGTTGVPGIGREPRAPFLRILDKRPRSWVRLASVLRWAWYRLASGVSYVA